MSTTEVRSNAAGDTRVDMKFETVVIPVSDADRAEEFYESLGVAEATGAELPS